LDEKILETARNRKIIEYKNRDKDEEKIKKLVKKLKERMSFRINNETYFLISNGNSSKEEIFNVDIVNIHNDIEKIQKSSKINDDEKKEKIEKLQLELVQLKKDEKELAFSLHGDFIHLPVKKDITENGDYRFMATKLISFKNSIKKDSLQLYKG